MTSTPNSRDNNKKRLPPATTPEARERQLVNLAMDLAEKQLIDGTASATVIVHHLKLATAREQKELVKLDLETKLLEARKDQINSQSRSEELYNKALEAFRSYSGDEEEGAEEYED